MKLQEQSIGQQSSVHSFEAIIPREKELKQK